MLLILRNQSKTGSFKIEEARNSSDEVVSSAQEWVSILRVADVAHVGHITSRFEIFPFTKL